MSWFLRRIWGAITAVVHNFFGRYGWVSRQNPPRVKSSAGHIYVISDGDKSRFKIGRTSRTRFQLESRYATHNVAARVELFLPSRDVITAEKEILTAFSADRVVNIHGRKSEWVVAPLEKIRRIITANRLVGAE